MIHPCDRRTDGRAIAYTRYSIYAVARKKFLTQWIVIQQLQQITYFTICCKVAIHSIGTIQERISIICDTAVNNLHIKFKVCH